LVTTEPPQIQQFQPLTRASSSLKTLRDILNIVEAHTGISEARRREIRSALRVLARCIGRPPEDIVVQPPSALQKQIAQVNHLQAGLKRNRWHNVRTLTLVALRLSGAPVMPSRVKRSNFSEEWSRLRQSCGSLYYLIGLSRFMNFCSHRGISPAEVCANTFHDFQHQLEADSIVRNPSQLYRTTCRLWGYASETVEGWPQVRVEVEAATQNYSFQWTTFPVSLKKDADAFLSFGGNRDIFSDDYVRSVRPATTRNRQKSIRQMATALAKSGVPLDQISSLECLVRPQNAQAILKFFIDRAGGTPNDHVYSMACLVRTIARSWVKNVADHPKLDKFCRAIRDASRKKRGMKERNRSRLRQFDDERNVSALLNLPRTLLRLAREQDTGTPIAANFAVYAAAIEILISSAIRIKNLTGLKLGQNVILPRDRKAGRIVLWIPEEDVKNGSSIEMNFSNQTSQVITAYVDEFRPKVSDVQSNWLFPSPRGQQRNINSFSLQISKVIKRHTGLVMHAHLFRHLALKLLEKDNPASAEIGRRFLAHANIRTTLNSYSEGSTAGAAEHYENLLERKRGTAGNIGKNGDRQ
jgi:integrase